MGYHFYYGEYDDSEKGFALIYPGQIVSFGKRLWIALKFMGNPNQLDSADMTAKNVIPMTSPNASDGSWVELPKVCERCKFSVITGGSDGTEQATFCPWRANHEEQTGGASPDICQAYNIIQ